MFQTLCRLRLSFNISKPEIFVIRTMSILPPSLKRRRLSSVTTTTTITSAPNSLSSNHVYPPPFSSTFRILSYNVNSITHLLPPEEDTKSRQKSITNFFTTRSSTETRKKISSGIKRDGSAHRADDVIQKQPQHHTLTQRPPAYLRQRLRHWHFPDVVCLQEVKISHTDVATQNRVKDAANRSPLKSINRLSKAPKRAADDDGGERNEDEEEEDDDDQGPEYEAFFCLSTDRLNARGMRGSGKVHGVCTLVRKRPNVSISQSMGDDEIDNDGGGGRGEAVLQARSSTRGRTVNSLDWDHEGRCLVLTVPFLALGPFPSTFTSSTPTTQHSKGLKIFNLYMPNGTNLPYYYPPPSSSITQSPSSSPSSPSSSLLLPPPTTRHVYKRNFHAHLANTVKDFETKGWTVVLAGDMNISRSTLDSYPQLRMGREHVKNREDFEHRFFLTKNNNNPSGLISTSRIYSIKAEEEEEDAKAKEKEKEKAKEKAKETVVEEESCSKIELPKTVMKKEKEQNQGEKGQGLGMIDTFRHMHPLLQKYSYRPRKPNVSFGAGGDRVDMILVSRHALALAFNQEKKRMLIVEADICDCEEERRESDHVPVWVGLDLSGYLR